MNLSQSERDLLTHVREAREKSETTPAKAEVLGVGVEGAYKIQAAMGEGRRLLGYKLGLLAPAKQTQMGVDAPIYGRVYEGMVMESPVSLSAMPQPRLEPELAVVLGADLPSDALPGAACLAVSGTFLAVDFLSSVWENYEFGAADVIADNASGGGFLLGERLLSEPLEGNLRLYHNGRLLAEGAVGDTGNVGERLSWLSKAVGGLEAGQVVFLGSPAAAVEAVPGTIELHGPHGSVLVADLQD